MVIANKVHSFDYPSACCLLFDDGDFGLLCTLVSEFGATSWKSNGKGSSIEDAEIMEILTAPVANCWQIYSYKDATCCIEIIRQPKHLDSLDFDAHFDKAL